MAIYEYDGKTYFFALGKWVDSDSNPVNSEIAEELSKKYSKETIDANEKAKRAKKKALPKNTKYTGNYFKINHNTSVSRPKTNNMRHKRASEIKYDHDFELTKDQKRALAILESGKNVFLTGEAGTGKSFVLKEYMHRNRNKNIIVCAFTGIAAINVGGSTLHRVFKAPLGVIRPGEYNKNPADFIVKADIIIIDEISMCRIDLFEYVIRSIRAAENKRQTYENMEALEQGRMPRVIDPKQIIVVGDFYQLAPVIGKNDETAFYTFWNRDTICDGFAYASSLWYDLDFKNIVLREIVRQSGDPEYIQNLNKIRNGDINGVVWFNEHVSREPLPGAIFLCGTNAKANRINDQRSQAITTESKIYRASTSGVVGEGDKMTSEELVLKVGMQVMTLVNDTNRQYQNGSIGKITALWDDHVDVRFNNGKLASVVYYDWEISGYEVHGDKIERVVLGNYKQLPLKIAYAITIHKSQGQTYSNVNISPECFAPGQLYVALSRAQTSKGMSFEHAISSGALKTSYHVKRFYEELIEDDEIYELKDIPEQKTEEIASDLQDNIADYVIKNDEDDERRHPSYNKIMSKNDEEINSCYMYQAMKNNPSAYAQWSDEEDNQLLKELDANMDVSELSRIHQRTQGAIRSRIKKLKDRYDI